MDPNQSLDALVKQMNRKPKAGNQAKTSKGQGSGKAKPVGPGRKLGQAGAARLAKGKQQGRQQGTQRQPQQGRQQGTQRQPQQQNAQQFRQGKQPVVKLNRRRPSAGILSRIGTNTPLNAIKGQPKGKSTKQSAVTRAAPATSKTQLAKHVEQVVQQRRLKELGSPKIRLQRKRLANLQAQTSPAQLRRPNRPSRTSSSAAAQLTVKINNPRSRTQLAAKKSLSRARASTASSSGVLSRDYVVQDVPSQPLTIQVENDMPARHVPAITIGRPQPTATVDSDLYRDPQSMTILQTSIRQNIITPAPVQGMGVDLSRTAVAALPPSSLSLHARFCELPPPSQASSKPPKLPVVSSASSSRSRTILG